MKRLHIILISAISALALFLGGLAYWQWAQKGRLSRSADEQIEAASQKLEEARINHERIAGELRDSHQRELVELNTEWNTRMEEERAASDQRIGRLFGQLNEIIHDSAQTAAYISDLETRLAAGETLAREEIETLQAIAGSLGYLKEQYRKPLEEFRELEQFLAEQLEIPPMPPEQRMVFIRRVFSRNYREEMAEYHRDLGRFEAFEASRTRLVEAYGRAQHRMQALTLETSDVIARLRELAEGKEVEAEKIAEFLLTGHRMLDIHGEVMRLREEPVEPAAEPVP